MSPRRKRLVAQIVVLVPTLTTSFALGYAGWARGPRLLASLAVGMVAIVIVGLWLRGPAE